MLEDEQAEIINIRADAGKNKIGVAVSDGNLAATMQGLPSDVVQEMSETSQHKLSRAEEKSLKISQTGQPVRAVQLQSQSYQVTEGHMLMNQQLPSSNRGLTADGQSPHHENLQFSKSPVDQYNQTPQQLTALQQKEYTKLLMNQQRMTRAKVQKPQSAVMRKRPQSASTQKNKRPQSSKVNQLMTATLPEQLYGEQSNMYQAPPRRNSPEKAYNQASNDKALAKLLPLKQTLSKEHLYATALDQKIVANQLRDENTRLQTRVNYLEQKLSMQDPTGHIRMLQKQLRASKDRYFQLSQDYRAQQLRMKTTQVNECRAENELYKQELIRLRRLCDKAMNQKLEESRFNNNTLIQDNSLMRADDTKSGSQTYQDLRLQLKRNHEQGKQILLLREEIKSQTLTHDEIMRQLNKQLAITQTLANERSNEISTLKVQMSDQQLQHEQDLTDLQEKLTSDFEQKCEEINQQHEQTLAEQRQDFEGKIAVQVMNVKNLEAEKASVKRELESALEEMQSEFEDVINKYEAQQAHCSEQKQSISSLEEQLAWKTKLAEDLEVELNKEQYKCQELEQARDSATQECSSYKHRVTQQEQMLQQATQGYTDELEKRNQDCAKLEQQIQQMEDSKAGQAQVEGLQAQVAAIQLAKSEEATKFESQIAALQMSINQVQDQKNSEVSKFESFIESLQSQIKELTEAKLSEASKFRAQIDTLQSQIKDNLQEKEATEASKNGDSAKFEQLTKSLKQEYETNLSLVKGEAKDSKQKLTDLQTENAQLKRQIGELHEQLHSMQDQMHSVQHANRNSQRRPTEPNNPGARILTTNLDNETFDRGDTISQIPSVDQVEEMDYEDAPQSDDDPFPAVKDSDDERPAKDVVIEVDKVDQTLAAPKLTPDVVSFAEVQKPTSLQEAQRAVLELNRHELDEISLQHNAGLGTQIVMEAVFTILGKPTGWENVRQHLKDQRFAEQVATFKPEDFPVDKLSQIQKFFQFPAFQFEKLKRDSIEAAILCQWVREIEAVVKTKGTTIESSQDASKQTADFQGVNIKVNAEQPPSSDPNRDQRAICVPDLRKGLDQVSEKHVIDLKSDPRVSVDERKDESQQEEEEELGPDNEFISSSLFKLKRLCQVKYVRFDQIENLIFGDDYRPEVRIQLEDLAYKLKAWLDLDSNTAQLFARYLVREGQNQQNQSQGMISPTTKVLQCKVVTLLQQNVNMYCHGVQVYSKKKEHKMKLIVGEAIQNVKAVYYGKWAHFAADLVKQKIEKETQDCAFVYCLRLANSLTDVDSETISSFIKECKDSAFSHSRTGLAFPPQIEIVKESEDEEPVEEEIPSSPEPVELQVPEKDNCLVSGSFDCNDRDASETNSPSRSRRVPLIQETKGEITPSKIEKPDNDDYSNFDEEINDQRESEDEMKYQQTDRTIKADEAKNNPETMRSGGVEQRSSVQAESQMTNILDKQRQSGQIKLDSNERFKEVSDEFERETNVDQRQSAKLGQESQQRASKQTPRDSLLQSQSSKTLQKEVSAVYLANQSQQVPINEEHKNIQKPARPQTAGYQRSFTDKKAESSKKQTTTYREVSSVASKDYEGVSDGDLKDPSNVSDIKSKDIKDVSDVHTKDYCYEVEAQSQQSVQQSLKQSSRPSAKQIAESRSGKDKASLKEESKLQKIEPAKSEASFKKLTQAEVIELNATIKSSQKQEAIREAEQQVMSGYSSNRNGQDSEDYDEFEDDNGATTQLDREKMALFEQVVSEGPDNKDPVVERRPSSKLSVSSPDYEVVQDTKSKEGKAVSVKDQAEASGSVKSLARSQEFEEIKKQVSVDNKSEKPKEAPVDQQQEMKVESSEPAKLTTEGSMNLDSPEKLAAKSHKTPEEVTAAFFENGNVAVSNDQRPLTGGRGIQEPQLNDRQQAISQQEMKRAASSDYSEVEVSSVKSAEVADVSELHDSDLESMVTEKVNPQKQAQEAKPPGQVLKAFTRAAEKFDDGDSAK